MRESALFDAQFDEAIVDGFSALFGEFLVLRSLAAEVGVTLDFDFLNARIVFERLGDFFQEAVGLFVDRRLVEREEDGFVDLDLVFGYDDATRHAAIGIITSFFGAEIFALAAEFVLEAFVVDPRIAIAVAIGIGFGATLRRFASGVVGAEVFALANVGIFIREAFFGDPRIAQAVAVVIDIGATVFVHITIEIFEFVGALIGAFADVCIFIEQAFFGDPRIADAVAVVIDIGATVFVFEAIEIFGIAWALIDALADIGKRFRQAAFRDPRIADAVVIGIGDGATVEFGRAGIVGAIVDVVFDAVAIAIADVNDWRCVITKAEADGDVGTSVRQFVGIEIVVDIARTRISRCIGAEIFEVAKCDAQIERKDIAEIETGFDERTN